LPHLGITEQTERPEFIDFLKQTLGIQFRLYNELSSSSMGHRLQEDIIVFNAADVTVDLVNNAVSWFSENAVISVIETKSKQKIHLEKDENQLFEYARSLKCKLAFLTNYSDIICYSFSPSGVVMEKTVHRSDTLSNLAEYVANKIQNNTEISIRKSPSEIMGVLEDTINELVVYTEIISGDTWESVLRLSDELERETKTATLSQDEKIEREKFFQRSAAYIAIAQILFYITLRQFRIDGNTNIYPKLRPLSSSNGVPTQVQEIIQDVPNNNLNFKAIFGKNKEVFSRLDDNAKDVLMRVIRVLEGTSARFIIENDLIGQIFQRLMPFETRKKFAAFYTCHSAAELLCRLAIKEKDASVYDPACGSGTLLVYSYRRKKELGMNQHKSILEQIKGSDISDIATMMSTINLAIQDPSKWTNHVNIYPHDAFSLISGLTRYFSHTQQSPDGRIQVSPIFAPDTDYRSDILIANPPFTRGTRITESERNVLRALQLVKKYDFKANFKSIGLYAFFLLIAPQLVKKEKGRIAFILPKGSISSGIMSGVWKILYQEDFGMTYLIEASDRDESFSDSSDQQIMVLLEKGYNGSVKVVKLLGELDRCDRCALAENIERAEMPFQKTNDFLLQVLPQSELREKSAMEWVTYPSKTMLLLYPKFIPLDISKLEENEKEKYAADLSREITIVTENASRPVDYWFIPNKYWNIDMINNDHITLQATSLNTAVSSQPNVEQKLTLPKDAFLPAAPSSLRQYQNVPAIIPRDEVNSYYLLDENRLDLKDYFEWGKRAHTMGLFGHAHSRYTPSLNAGGLLTKIDFYGGKTLVLRFLTPMVGSRMIILGFRGENDLLSDLFFSYMTSSIFLLDALEKARIRRAEFARINQIDLYKKYRFPNFNRILQDNDVSAKILETSRKHSLEVPLKERLTIPKAVRNARKNHDSTLRKLDEAWLKALDLPADYLDVLYQEIEERMKDIEAAQDTDIRGESQPKSESERNKSVSTTDQGHTLLKWLR
jgi:type I restriction-modification system DNA methylase subunit